MSAEGTFRLELDASRCDGRGMCVLVMPERLSLDPWGFGRAEPDPISGRGELRRARRAVACCPQKALALVPVAAE
jgi:ferredoxin